MRLFLQVISVIIFVPTVLYIDPLPLNGFRRVSAAAANVPSVAFASSTRAYGALKKAVSSPFNPPVRRRRPRINKRTPHNGTAGSGANGLIDTILICPVNDLSSFYKWRIPAPQPPSAPAEVVIMSSHFPHSIHPPSLVFRPAPPTLFAVVPSLDSATPASSSLFAMVSSPISPPPAPTLSPDLLSVEAQPPAASYTPPSVDTQARGLPFAVSAPSPDLPLVDAQPPAYSTLPPNLPSVDAPALAASYTPPSGASSVVFVPSPDLPSMVAPPSAPPPGPLSEDVSPPVLLVAVRDSHLVQPPPALLHWKLPFLPFTLPSGPRPLVVGVLVGCLVGLACIWQGLSARTPRPRRTEAQQLAPGHVDNATTGLAAVQAQLRINEQHLEDARRLLVEQAQLAAQEKACLDWERFELGVIAEQLQEELRQATAAKQAEAKRFERERRTMEGRVRLAEKNLEDQERIEAQTVIFLAEEARQGPLAKKQLKAARQEIKELRKKIEEDATQTAASKQELKARCRLAEQRLKQEQEVHSQEAIVARLERERLHEVLAARDASPTNIPSIALPPTSTRASPAAPPGAASSSSYLLPSPPSILTLSQISPRAPVQDTGDDTPARSHPDAPFGARREAHVARFGYSDVQAGGPLSASGQERFVERELRHYGPCDAEETEMVRNFAGVKVGLGHSNGARPRHSRSRT